jgi:hypothetical protein
MAEHVFFAPAAVPEFFGPGPSGTYSPFYAARRELWTYTLSLIEDPALNWCEFGVGDGESLDWFALRKPRSNTLFAFDSFRGIPEAWVAFEAGAWKSDTYRSNRKDLVVVEGLFDDTLKPDIVKRIGRIGLLHVDCDLYSSTRTVLNQLNHLIQPGTLIIFDEFYNYPQWQQHEAKAFSEFVLENKIQFEYLGRTPSCQLSVRILGRGNAAGWSVRKCAWAPLMTGIQIRKQ